MNKLWDLVIIGGGPAGLSAAIYAAREQHQVLIIEAQMTGGMMALTSKVDNYPGFALGTSGFEIAQKMTDQAKSLGVEIEYSTVVDVLDNNKIKTIELANGDKIETKIILIASGTEYRHLNVPGEAEMLGKGVHFCATCDGPFYQDKTIAVIGGGNSAIEEAKFLTKFAKKIYLLVRDKITASAGLVKEIDSLVKNGQIELILSASTTEILHNDKSVTGIKYQTNGETKTLDVSGVFVFIGLIPRINFIDDLSLKLDQYGFVKANQHNMTNIKGIFVAGDIRSEAIRQIATASGDGVKAALEINKFLDSY